MKKNFLVLSLFIITAAASRAQTENSNVSLSNISSNNGFDSYSTSTKTISGIYFEVLADLFQVLPKWSQTLRQAYF